MSIRSGLVRLITIIVAGVCTVAHQASALQSWPQRSVVGEILMSAHSLAVVVLVLVTLIVGGTKRAHADSVGVDARDWGISACVLGAIIVSVLYIHQIIPTPLANRVSASPWIVAACSVVVAVCIAILTFWRGRKHTVVQPSRTHWGAFEIGVCFLLALNMFFIALPEIRFVWGSIGHSKVASASFWPSFALFYSDTQRVVLNPIYDLLRYVLAWYTPEYFLIPVSCIYLMALAIAFFCAGISSVVGYYGSIAMAAGLCWSKEVLLSVFMVTNLGTLLLTVGLSVWVLSQAVRAVQPGATSLRIIRTGLFIGAVGLFSLYAYAASRSVCVPFLGGAVGLLAFHAVRGTRRRVSYLVSLVSIIVIPGVILLSEYYGKWSAFVSDFRAGVPSMSKIYYGRPAFIDPNAEASTPDLPAYYAAIIADTPQPDGSVQRKWVYWYRSPSEFAWVMWNNITLVLDRYLPFPGGKAAWFFWCVGLFSLMAMTSSPRKAALIPLVILIVSLILISPFLIILSPNDWRRGIAVVLVFASLSGLGVYKTVKLCFPRVHDGLVAAAACALIFVMFGRPAIDTIAATPISHSGIAMVCTFNPVRPLVTLVRTDKQMSGQVLLAGSKEDRCLYSASRQLDTMLGGSNRVRLLDAPVYELARVKEELAPGDSIALHCGPLTGGAQLKFCEELRSSSEARLVFSAPADGNEIWVVTKDYKTNNDR